MASSSVSQDDVDVDFEICSRRSRIRTARARNINPPPPPRTGEANEDGDGSDKESGVSGLHPGHQDHDASPKPTTRLKEKRMNRPNHTNKGKQQRDRRKLREKRRSTGVVQLYSTESTGGSTGEDEELLSMNAETRRNTHYNENLEKKEREYNTVNLSEHRHKKPSFTSIRSKSPSDLEADDEDNQDYDSLTMSDSTLSLVQPSGALLERGGAIQIGNLGNPPSSAPLTATRPTNGRPATPITDSLDEQLERAREENRRLLALMEEKDKKITNLEAKLGQLSYELTQANNEKSNLRQENSALIRAMASLSSK
ncbi:UNVERIFIED_CONTAM: hypothetical protein RMT77_007647 [Armadillidium vulgare]